MESLLTFEGVIALFTLTLLEIVLGIDNIIFISIISNKLPEKQRPKARTIGLALALLVRIAMLFAITWIIGFKEPLFTVFGFEASGRDLILAAGGMFLIAKSTSEIHQHIEGAEKTEGKAKVNSFFTIIGQIVLLDIVFSFDSILTAVGMTEEIAIMIIAVVISMGIMLFFAKAVSDFITKHPTLQMLALSFLILIGFMLCIEAVHIHVPKGYIYFAVFFSLIVEVLNMAAQNRKKRKREGK